MFEAGSGMTLVLLLHAAVTLFLTGLVWFVQLVHYPLMAETGREVFPRYEHLHQQRTTWIVAPAMAAEALLALWLLWRRPAEIPFWTVALAGLLLAGIWVSTFAVQVPLHAKLAAGFDAQAHHRLVLTNWWRTAAWSLRSLLALWFLSRL